MTTKKDYYEILGVPRDADDKAIKAAYRKLARKYHPDVNAGSVDAEERFKEVAEAFAVLSDPARRRTYDAGGHEAFGPDFDPFAGARIDFESFGLGDLSDVFEMFRSGRRRTRAATTRGEDMQFEMRIPFVDAVLGTTVEISMPARQGVRGSERVKVRIPPGIEDGGRVRLAGKGGKGARGGPAGNAYLHVSVEPHPMFRRDGRDVVTDVPVGIAKASLGGALDVPTLDGSTKVTLPAGTRSGQKLRLRGKGVPAHGGRAAGDLYAVIQIVAPKHLDARSRELLEEFARLNPGS